MDVDTASAKRKAPVDSAVVKALAKKLKITATHSQPTDKRKSGGISSNSFIGTDAPPFYAPAVMPDGEIKNVSLNDYRGRYLALLFYPADFTFVCPTEITGFNDSLAQFNALDCDVIVCSTDSEYVHYNWRLQARRDGGVGDLSVPMVSDRTRTISRSYNVLCEQTGQAFRGLFVIDRSQRLRVSVVNDMPVGRSVSEALRLVAELKASDES
ncbi:Peroxiredoxin [Coemansia sp. RSA 2399]|nr:Peroxiredoxin [Coemansia sp. RSA 2399]KAJ1908416.1 Peroxiredoxin [Coemansia sp. IMI 209127]